MLLLLVCDSVLFGTGTRLFQYVCYLLHLDGYCMFHIPALCHCDVFGIKAYFSRMTCWPNDILSFLWAITEQSLVFHHINLCYVLQCYLCAALLKQVKASSSVATNGNICNAVFHFYLTGHFWSFLSLGRVPNEQVLENQEGRTFATASKD